MKMSRRFSLLILAGVVALMTNTGALSAKEIPEVTPLEAGLIPEKLAEVDKFMESQLANKKLAGGLILVAHEGKIGFFQTYGQRDLEAGKPMERDTIFRLYSMSKAITTAAALTLVDAGKIRLDDPVSRHIPMFKTLQVATTEGLRAPAREMTVQDLMLHTSGFSYGNGPEALKEAFGRLKPLESSNLEEMATQLSQVSLAHDSGAD